MSSVSASLDPTVSLFPCVVLLSMNSSWWNLTAVRFSVVFRRRLCDSHKHPNNVGKHSSRPETKVLWPGRAETEPETPAELSVSSSRLHLLQSRFRIISHDNKEQDSEDRRGERFQFHLWQVSRWDNLPNTSAGDSKASWETTGVRLLEKERKKHDFNF